MSIETLVEATVSAIVSAAPKDVWPTVRNRMARVLRPSGPDAESAYLDKLLHEAPADEGWRKELVRAYVTDRLRRYPEPERGNELYRELSLAVGEVGRLIFEAETPEVHSSAPGQTFYPYDRPGRQPDPVALTPTRDNAAARMLEGMSPDAAATRLWATPTESAANRLALMPAADKLLSSMDSKLAASLLTAMAPPRPAEIFMRIVPDRGAAILGEMDTGTAVRRLTEIADRDLGIAARLLYTMKESAANLLAAMSPPYPAELLGQMPPGPAAQVLSAMPVERAAMHLAAMRPDLVAAVLGKMDKALATGFLTRYAPERAAGLLALMVPAEGAELLARMEVLWARDRLTEMSADQALKLLVALRLPHTLISVIDGRLAVTLLGEAVVTLAGLAENQALLESAHAEAARIREEAEAQAQQILGEAEGVREEVSTNEPASAPALAASIMDRLSHRKNQTVAKLAASLRVSVEAVNEELNRLEADGEVTVSYKYRGGLSYYNVRQSASD
jgi:flagellar motility protein MotE (MotC chaperone)